MKYFITENGLEPFDLTPTELTNILLYHNYKKEGDKSVSPDDIPSFKLASLSIKQIMNEPYGLFKHPDMNIDDLIKMIRHQSTDYLLKTIVFSDYHLIKDAYVFNSKNSIIISLANKMYYFREKDYHYHTIQYLLVDAPIIKCLERKLTIDTILKDLQE